MKSDAILAKTTKGLDEVHSRAHKLSQRVRMVLLLVDGRTPVGQFAAKLTAVPEFEEVLDALLHEGFVAEVASSAPTGAASVAAGGPATRPLATAAEPPSADMRKAVRELCRFLHDNLGPQADDVSARLERAASRAEFIELVRQGQNMLVAAAPGVRQGGMQKAQQFQSRAQSILETFFAAR